MSDYADPNEARSLVVMATADERADQPARDEGLNAYSFSGEVVNGGAPMLAIPGFDGRHRVEKDQLHVEVVTGQGEGGISEQDPKQLELIWRALENLENVSFDFVNR